MPPTAGRRRSAVLWLQLLFVASIASVVLVLVAAVRAAQSSQIVAEHALADYANFAAWSYREHLLTRIREGVDELLGPVNHGEGLHTGGGIPDARKMGHMMAWDPSCYCHHPRHGPLPKHYLGFTLGSDTLAIGINFAEGNAAGWLGDPDESFPQPRSSSDYPREQSRWINRALTAVARRHPKSPWGYDFIVDRYDGATQVFASRSMPTDRGDTIVYALEYTPEALNALLGGILYSSDLLPASLVSARANRDVIDLEVSDASGVLLFRSGAAKFASDLVATTTLPVTYGRLRVSAQLRPELASALLIGGVPRSRVPLMLAILAVAVGLSLLAAVQLRREVRFAGERAAFVANVSHELRTPLTQVRLVLDTLRLGRGGDEASRDRALGVANREVLRLQHLVEGVLRFARGPRHDEPLVRGDVAQEVRSVVAEFEPLAAPRGVSVSVTNGAPCDVTLRRDAVRHVLLNLLDNAVKYGGENAQVTVDVQPMVQGGVRLSVSDRGPGVPEAERERIWRPFERGGAARRRAAGGSGIGLAVVREIAEEHRGRAWVETADGGGAKFVVELHNAAP